MKIDVSPDKRSLRDAKAFALAVRGLKPTDRESTSDASRSDRLRESRQVFARVFFALAASSDA